MKKFAAALAFATLSTGCAGLMPGFAPPSGGLYTGVKGVSPTTQVEVSDGVRPGPKQGQSCASGVLGLAAWGDMSVDTAKKTGGITRVDTIDYSQMSILGIVYAKHCTIVTGE